MTRIPSPPRLARALFSWLIPPPHREAFLTDLEEDFRQRVSKRGIIAAHLWYWLELLRCRPFSWRRLRRRVTVRATPRTTGSSLASLTSDFRMALRQFPRHPGFALAVIATLAFGIGANTAIFSIVNQIMLKDLPYHDPDRLVLIWNHMRNVNAGRTRASGPDFLDYREQTTLLDGIAGIWSGTTTLTGADRAEQVVEAKVTENVFSVLGVEMALGRAFREGEGSSMDFTTLFSPGQEVTTGSVIVSYGLWQRRFGADPDVIGRTIHIDGVPAVIVGVLPDHFQIVLPPDAGVPPRIDLFEAFRSADLYSNPRQARWLTVIARVEKGVTLPQVQAEVDAIATRLREQFQEHAQVGTRLAVSSLHADAVRHARPILTALLGAVSFVFLIACANVAGLLLVRGLARRTEMAIRTSLGGTPFRLIRQLLMETVLLAAVGAVAGLVLARMGIDALLLLQPDMLPAVREVSMDARVVVYAAVLTLLAAAVAAFAPAMHFVRLPIAHALHERQHTGGPGSQRLRSVLTVFQVAMSVVLLAGAALMARSLLVLRRTDPGFQSERVVTAKITLPQFEYLSENSRAEFFRRLLPDLVKLPTIEAVGGVRWVPLEENAQTGSGAYLLEGEDESRWTTNGVMYRPVLPGFFSALQIPVTAGRIFTLSDVRPNARPLAVVDVAFARRAWPGETALGKRLQVIRFNAELQDFVPVEAEVIGVVENVHHASLAFEDNGTVYAPPTVWPWTEQFSLVVRTAANSAYVVQQIRDAVAAIDANVPVSNVRTMISYLDAAVAPTTFVLDVFAAFALGAVLLTAIGLYGVIAFTVRQRTREIGLRIAFGAAPESVLALILRRGVSIVLAGVGLGVVGTLALGGVVQSQLVGVTPTDPVTLVAVSALMIGIAMAASYIPARRATRIDPIEALRED